MKRRDFIKHASSGLLLLASGNIIKVNAHPFDEPLFRFIVASDGHYGQPKTDYDPYFNTFTKAVNDFHTSSVCDCIVMNGDIIHDNPLHLDPAVSALKQLQPRLFVTKGNHDRVSDAVWKEKWGMPVNHDVVIKDQVILLGTTSNEAGEYLCPDVEWLEMKLEQYRKHPNIFIFLHITPVKWTKNAVSCDKFQKLVKQYQNIKAVFNGHDHDQDGLKMLEKTPFLFDGHIGGNWGTDYKGFRVVEPRKDNSLLTYMMNPYIKISEEILPTR